MTNKSTQKRESEMELKPKNVKKNVIDTAKQNKDLLKDFKAREIKLFGKIHSDNPNIVRLF